VVIIQDLMDVCYWLTRLKLTPTLAEQPSTPEIERTKGKEMADALTLPIFTRAWQMLLKGLGETQFAPSPIQAAEMVLIRLIHVSDLPTPEDIVKKLEEGGAKTNKAPSSTPAATNTNPAAPTAMASTPPSHMIDGNTAVAQATATIAQHEAMHQPDMEIAPVEDIPPQAEPTPASQPAKDLPQVDSFRDVIKLMSDRREGVIVKNLTMDVHLVKFEQGFIEFRTTKMAPKDLIGRLGKLLSDWTGKRWMVTLSNETGETTIHEQDQIIEKGKIDEAGHDPLVKAVLGAFPTAQVKKVIARAEEFDDIPPASDAVDED